MTPTVRPTVRLSLKDKKQVTCLIKNINHSSSNQLIKQDKDNKQDTSCQKTSLKSLTKNQTNSTWSLSLSQNTKLKTLNSTWTTLLEKWSSLEPWANKKDGQRGAPKSKKRAHRVGLPPTPTKNIPQTCKKNEKIQHQVFPCGHPPQY